MDASTRASAGLAALIEKLVNDPDREPPESLGEVRELLRAKSRDRQTEFLHPQDRESLLVELDGLIEELGEEAASYELVGAKAGEALSRVIEAAMDDTALPEEPTLGAVREAMLGGLAARLVGDGAIDEDDDAALLAEIDELIRRFGANAPAEPFVRFE